MNTSTSFLSQWVFVNLDIPTCFHVRKIEKSTFYIHRLYYYHLILDSKCGRKAITFINTRFIFFRKTLFQILKIILFSLRHINDANNLLNEMFLGKLFFFFLKKFFVLFPGNGVYFVVDVYLMQKCLHAVTCTV